MLDIYCSISVDRENQNSIKEQELLSKEFVETKGLNYPADID